MKSASKKLNTLVITNLSNHVSHFHLELKSATHTKKKNNTASPANGSRINMAQSTLPSERGLCTEVSHTDTGIEKMQLFVL